MSLLTGPGAAALLAALFLSSCCSVVNGSTQVVNIKSTPEGAWMTIDGKDRGLTPQEVTLKRREDHVVRIEAYGYKPYEHILKSSISWKSAGDLVFLTLAPVAILVDACTGSLWAFDDLNAEMTPEPSR